MKDLTQAKDLCLSLMKADTEEEVNSLLKKAGYWDNPAVWRFYGDRETNSNTIGNQQSRPDSALVEKLVNSVDARLMNECLVRGIAPEGPSAPQTIRQAVAQFLGESTKPDNEIAGRISEWSDSKRTAIARGITLTATGLKPPTGNPSFTISDCGEGQTPEKLPHTILSLDKSNKLRIPFVQGKFNMGGTGVLKFCGKHKLQLILSRRNPEILKGNLASESDSQWGFTIVRREKQGIRSSVYTYLAPIGTETNPNKGGVLRFSADEMPIFPEGRNPYSRNSAWGTLIKLYEYEATGFRSNTIMERYGLLRRLDILLPEVALPIRLHECRYGEGHGGSFETTLTGLSVRLADGKGENLEEPPYSCPISVIGEQMTATIYAFKKGKADTYRRSEGMIFTLNGQTHGHFTPDFFRRKNVGLSYLADSVLVLVDCSGFSGQAREDLFMNSRDRLSNGDLRLAIERQLEEMLKHNDGLRALKERRRREEIESKLDDSKPLENILESLLKKSPTLSALFLRGNRLSNPFKAVKKQAEEKPYTGERYPTYFKFKGKEYGTELHKDCHVNMRCRITFETDAVNDYFSRAIDRGEFSLYRVVGDSRHLATDYVGPNLQNGSATLSIQLPANCCEGDVLQFVATVTDRTRIEPFENFFVINVKEEAKPSGGNGKPRKPPTDKDGKDYDLPSGISLPEIKEVYESDWESQSPPFDKYTALHVKNAGVFDENGRNGEAKEVYDFYVNMDNLFLKSELKSSTDQDSKVTRAKFKYGMVLLGLALLHQEAQDKKKRLADEDDDESNNDESKDNVEDKVAKFSRAIAPVLLPVIDSLGALDLESDLVADASGEAT